NENGVPMEVRCQPDHFSGVFGNAHEDENFGARSLEDRYGCIQMLVREIVGDIDTDHPGNVAEPVLHALEDLPAEIIVLPKGNDPLARVERLNVVGGDGPFLSERRLPTHGDRKSTRL